MAQSGWCHIPQHAESGSCPQGRGLASWEERLGQEPRILCDGLDVVLLNCLLLRKPGPGNIVRARQQVGRA